MGQITINQESLKPRRDWKRFKVQDGENVYRILPPFGDVTVHNNYPYRKWSIVWLIDPKTGRKRPFASPMTDSDSKCPVKEYNDAMIQKADELKQNLIETGNSKEQIKGALKPIYDVLWNVNIQHLYTYNATNKSGENGLLELKSTAHKALKKMMSQYIKDYGQDPTSLNSDQEDSGVWFNFTKDGVGKETEYGCDFNKIKRKVDGELIYSADRSPISDNIVQNYVDLGYDLNSLYVRKTYDELYEILLYNIDLLSKEFPVAIIDGFDPSTMAFEREEEQGEGQVEEQQLVEDKPPFDTEVEEPVQETRLARKQVTLKVDADDENVEVETIKRVSPPVEVRTATVKTTVTKVAAPAAPVRPSFTSTRPIATSVKTIAPTTVAKSIATLKSAKTVEEEDIFAMADSILNS